MGPTGLTAVFEMGTGVAPPVWSPGSRPAGLFGPAGREVSGGSEATPGVAVVDTSGSSVHPVTNAVRGRWRCRSGHGWSRMHRESGAATPGDWASARVGVVKPLGC